MAEKSTFIKIDRNIIEWEWYQNSNTKDVFIHLLIMASFKDKKYAGIQLKRGEYITTHAKLAAALGLTVQNVRTALEHLKSTGEVTITRHSNFLVISVKNYDFYQSDYENQQTSNRPLTEYQQTSNRPSTIKQERKEREERKEGKNQSVSPPETKPEISDTVENPVEIRQTDRQTSSKNQNAFSKPMDFSVMLYNLGSPLYQEGFRSEEELKNYDIEDREIQKCRIPDSFRHNLQTMQNALKYLTGYSCLREGDFKEFADAVILCLSEIICFGTDNEKLVASPDSVLDYLNEINMTVTIGSWMESLSFKYSRILERKAAEGETIRNKHAFLKICAVNYLKEYRAEDICPGFKQ